MDHYVKKCLKCRQQNLRLQRYDQFHSKGPSEPIHLIAMDIIGHYKPSDKGCQYALTIINVLTNYFLCIFLVTKEAVEVIHAYQ